MRLLLLLITLPLFAAYQEPWGPDAELNAAKTETAAGPHLGTKIGIACIRFHQKVISPIDGPRSHFVPCSSQYTLLAMKKHGFWQGYLMGCSRLLRENGEMWVYETKEVDGYTYKVDKP
ncbi:MAG: membrane protein insertion efficiency factor YidD [Parachlamydiales bacterium]